MKMFIWEHLGQVTDRYHPEGGLVVIAESIKEAKDLVKSPIEIDKKPDHTYKVEAEISEIFVFPDAGCE